jgi:hypothetical protein
LREQKWRHARHQKLGDAVSIDAVTVKHACAIGNTMQRENTKSAL